MPKELANLERFQHVQKCTPSYLKQSTCSIVYCLQRYQDN